MMHNGEMDNALEQVSKAEIYNMCGVLRNEIDILPRVGKSIQKCHFCNLDLERVRRDGK